MAVQDEEKWLLADGEEDGKYLLFRVRQELPAGLLKFEFPALMSVYWTYDPTTNEGMPDDPTSDVQFQFEQTITPLNDRAWSELMLVIVGGGRKEWHFYARDPERWVDQFNQLLGDQPDLPIEIETQPDPDWGFFESVRAGIADANTESNPG